MKKPRLDLDIPATLAMHYSKSTGVSCKVIDVEGNILYQYKAFQDFNFCERIEEQCGDESFCKKYRSEAALYSKRFGGKYIFLCPLGYVNWTSPILLDGELVGAFLCGSYLLSTPQHKLVKESLEKFNLSDNAQSDLHKMNIKASYIDTDKVNSLSELLFIMASYVSDIHGFKKMQYDEDVQKNLSSITNYIQHLKELEKKQAAVPYPHDLEEMFYQAVENGQLEEAKGFLNQIIAHLHFYSGANLESIKTKVMEIIVFLPRLLNVEKSRELVFDDNHQNLIDQIYCATSIDQLVKETGDAISWYIQSISLNRYKSHGYYIYKVTKYINRHYMNKVSLEDVAKEVHLSPNYLSSIFRMEMKMSFNAYLNKVRIDQSKQLLLTNDMSLQDIVQMVGFTDQSYFTKVFKRYVGVTPFEYRRSKGRITAISEVKNR